MILSAAVDSVTSLSLICCCNFALLGIAGGGQPQRCTPTLLHHHPTPYPLLHPLLRGESVGQHQTIRYVRKLSACVVEEQAKVINAVFILYRCWKCCHVGYAFLLSSFAN